MDKSYVMSKKYKKSHINLSMSTKNTTFAESFVRQYLLCHTGRITT